MTILAGDRFTSELVGKYVRREMLISKFEIVPGDIKRKIEDVDNTSILKGLLKKLLTVSSIEEFAEFLNEIKSKA